MDNDLKEALEAIKDLRAMLHLARHEPHNVTDEDEAKLMAETDALLLKHGDPDDMIEGESNGD